MATQEVKFTKANLDRIPHPESGRERYRDRRFDNLYLEVTTKSKTWRYRKFTKGRNITKTLGTWPKMDYSVALRQVDALDASVANDTPVITKEITLREALDRHARNPVDPRTKRKSENTIYDYENTIVVNVPDWLDKPIHKITRAMVNERIRQLSNKPTTATKLLRILSAIYGNELAIRDDFDHDPTYRVKAYTQEGGDLLFDIEKPWPAIGLIAGVDSSRERAMWGVMLFSGIRMGNVRHIEWDHLDLDAKQLTIPKLKNGQRRTFPMSDLALAALDSVPKIHDRWVFASATKNTPMANLRALGDPKTWRPHDTRRLFTTAVEKCPLSGFLEPMAA